MQYKVRFFQSDDKVLEGRYFFAFFPSFLPCLLSYFLPPSIPGSLGHVPTMGNPGQLPEQSGSEPGDPRWPCTLSSAPALGTNRGTTGRAVTEEKCNAALSSVPSELSPALSSRALRSPAAPSLWARPPAHSVPGGLRTHSINSFAPTGHQ